MAATMPSRDGFSPTAERPAPVAIVAGTADWIVLFEGGRMGWWARRLFRVDGDNLAAEQTARYFAARNGLADTPPSPPTPQGARVLVDTVMCRRDGRPHVIFHVARDGATRRPGRRPHRGS